MLMFAPALERRQVGPVSVHVATSERAIDDIVEASVRRRPLRVAFANTHLLYCALQDAAFAAQLTEFELFNDGVGMDLMARFACGASFPENLNGTDLTPRFLAALPAGSTIYLLGSRRDVVLAAADRARNLWPQLSICAARDGYEQCDVALAEIAWLKPDVILVAMGNPLQEKWIARCATRHGGVYIGVGALFDFLAGAAPRAPMSWRLLRAEWLFRLMQEPGRLWQRYTLEIGIVALALLRNKFKGKAA